MGFISDIQSEQKVSITFYSKNVSVVNGVPQPEGFSKSVTVTGLFWTGTSRVSNVSDKIKTEVEGSISVDYNATIAALSDNSKFAVGSNYYQILHIDNVGQQNEVLQISYKRVDSI